MHSLVEVEQPPRPSLPRGVHRGHLEDGTPIHFAYSGDGHVICAGYFNPAFIDEAYILARLAATLDLFDPPGGYVSDRSPVSADVAVLPLRALAPQRSA